MKVDLVNSSKIPTKKILALIKFCKPKNGKLPKIYVKDLKDETKAYDCDFHYFADYGQTKPYIIFRFSGPHNFPLTYQMRADKMKRKGYVGSYEFQNFTENLIFLFAHELHHSYLWENLKTRHYYYQNKKKTETLADRFALRKLKKFRELKAAGEDPLK